MSSRSFVASLVAWPLGVISLSAWAASPAFNESETRALQELIQTAISRALSDQSVGDDDPRTQPPATVVWSHEAPGLTESQRVALARMVDDAVHRVLTGETPIAEAATPPVSQPNTGADGIDDSLPMTDLTVDTLRGRVASDQGFDVVAARAALETGPGSVQSALAQTDTGLNSSATAPKTSSVQIIASGEGSRASLKVDQSSSDADALGSGVYWSRSAVFSAPIDKNDALGTELIGLDGLTNGFEVAYNATRIRTEPLGRPGNGHRSLLFEMPEACTSLGIPINECDYSTLMRVAHAKSSSHDKAAEIANRFALTGRAWVKGFRLKAGYDDYTFFDPGNLAKREQDEVPWSTGVFGGVLAGTRYYSVGLDYQHAYKAAASGTACPAPVPDAAVTRCVSGALGAPSSSERHLLNLEGRWLFGERAVGVKLVHDFKNGNWGVDVPVYLFPNEKGLLSGGLRFGWTDIDQFSAAIFVGVPFKLLD